MNSKNNKIVLIALPIFLASLIAAILYFKEEHDHGHDHHHHHGHGHSHEDELVEEEEYIQFSPEQIQRHQIAIREANPGTLTRIIEVPGRIELHSDLLAHVVPKVSGMLMEVRKSWGDNVEKGEILAILQSREIAESKSAYLASLKKELLRKTIYERERELHNGNISSKNEFLEAEHAYEEAKIELDLNRQKLYAIGLTEQDIGSLPEIKENELGRYEIRSPIAGTVIDRHATRGEYLKEDHEAFTIANLKELLVSLNVYQKDLGYLRVGESITIQGPHGEASATLQYISPIIDTDTHTAQAFANLQNANEEWYPGTYVKGQIAADPLRVSLAVPKAALQKIDGVSSLFIATQNGFEIRPVKIGKSDDLYAEIVDGLEPGERYASENSFLIKAEHDKHEAEHEH